MLCPGVPARQPSCNLRPQHASLRFCGVALQPPSLKLVDRSVASSGPDKDGVGFTSVGKSVSPSSFCKGYLISPLFQVYLLIYVLAHSIPFCFAHTPSAVSHDSIPIPLERYSPQTGQHTPQMISIWWTPNCLLLREQSLPKPSCRASHPIHYNFPSSKTKFTVLFRSSHVSAVLRPCRINLKPH